MESERDAMLLSGAQRRNYLARGGVYCPVCGTNDIEGGDLHIDRDTGEIWTPVSCNECGVKWHDVYKLNGIESDERRHIGPETYTFHNAEVCGLPG